jgi:DNA replication protein DnaC
MSANLNQMGLWRRSDVPKRHALKVKPISLDSLSKDWSVLHDRLLTQIRKRGALLIFTGGRGCGKTQMAVSLIAHRCLDEVVCKYTTAADMYRTLRSSFDDDSEVRLDKQMNLLCGRGRLEPLDLLVIDEVHERKASEWEQHRLTEIIDARYNRDLTTILITNEKPEEAVDTLGPSIVDRARETGSFVPFRWGSFRPLIREQEEV